MRPLNFRGYNMFGLFKTAKKDKNIAEKIYGIISLQSRNKIFYTFNEVKDDVNGRFDMLILHAVLVAIRLEKEKGTENESKAEELSQKIFDELFNNMDLAVREMGIGDLKVGKYIKNMMQAYYGRMEAYFIAIEHYLKKDDIAVMEESLVRNLYGGVFPSDKKKLRMMAYYVIDSYKALISIDYKDIEKGTIFFVQPPGADYKDIV